MHEATEAAAAAPLITNDAVILGVLMTILALVFWSSASEWKPFKVFYSVVPALLMCYFLPSLLTTFGVIDPEQSRLYFVASRFLLPASLVLLTLSIDLPAVLRLGWKAVAMFLTATVGIMLGGPIALFLMHFIAPDVVGGVGPDAVWRGMTTVAGSWIGGGANQAAMKEVFQVGNDLFAKMVAVDVLVANVWMAVLLFAAGRSDAIDARTGADNSAIHDLRRRVENYQTQIARLPKLKDTMLVLAAGFGITALGHVGADLITPWLDTLAQDYPFIENMSLNSSFLWLVVIATTGGLALSFTRARQLEGVGASRVGSALLYVLIASIGMGMNIRAIFQNPMLFLLGLLWMLVHVTLLLIVAKIIKAPVFFVAVGSQANVGGAASAPVVASAFHPALASVGVLLAVLGYALGTYCALVTGYLMQAVAAGWGG